MAWNPRSRGAVRDLAIAVLAVAVGAGVRLGPLRGLGLRVPYVTFYLPVIFAALYGGFVAGILATLLSALLVGVFWIEPVGRLAIGHPADWVGMAIFIVSSITVSWLAERARRAQQRALEAESQAKLSFERERSAEQIRRISERLRLAAEAAGIGIWSWTPGRPELVVDATWRQLLGSPPDTPATLESWRNALHPEDRDRVNREFKTAVEQRGDFVIDYRVIRVDGTVRWLSDRGRAAHPEAGQGYQVAGITLDVTERKQAEENRRQEGERLRRLNRALEAIRRSDQALLQATDESAFLKETCRIVVEECGHAMVWIGFRQDDEAKSVFPVASAGFDQGYLEALKITWADCERGRGPTGSAIRTGEVQFCRHMLIDPSFLPWREEALRRGYASSVSLPLVTEGEPFGALTIYSREPDGFPDDELKLLAELAADLAYGISVLRLRSAHTRTEQLVRESEERLRLAYDAANAGAWEWDIGTNENVWSEEIWKVYGLEPHSVTPSYEAWLEVIHPDDRARSARTVQEAARNGTELEFEFRVRRPEAADRWLLARGRPLRDPAGRVVRYIGIVLDVTERKRAEDAVERASAQRRLALEAAELGAWDYRFDTGEVYWDARCRDLFGMSSGDRVDYTSAIACIHPDDRGATDEAVNRAIAGHDGGAYHREFRVLWPDGSEHWVSSHGRAYFEGDGEKRRAVRFVGVNLDITERKRAEESLRQAQKLESIGLLAGGIAHDFNNLLVGVIGNASLAQEMLPPDSQVDRVLKGIIKAGEQAAHLTRQMLAYAGKGQFVLEVIDLSALVRESTVLLQSSISGKIALKFDLASSMPAVEADPGQMQQVFTNLVLNAAEAIGDQPGVIAISTGEQDVTVSQIRDELLGWPIAPGAHVFLEVRDTGCGMSEEARTRIYDPFFTTKFQGRGLGLAAVSGIVRSLNGAIKLTSAPGAGCTFRVLFPASKKSVTGAHQRDRRRELSRGTILVIDDEDVVLDLARRSLERQGHEVLVAADGPSAIELARSHGSRIKLAILDSGLPGMSGGETLIHLRNLLPALDVIISSGYAEAEALRPFEGERISGFVQKPYLARDLARAVKTALDAHRPTS